LALSIFVATQKGDFVVERSKIINSPKAAVYNYVNDYRNWEDFSSLTNEDPEVKITYSQNTIGSGSSFSWEGKDGSGDIQTFYVKENNSLSQKMNYNGNLADVSLNFKDTTGGTKVTWKAKGKMTFKYKILTLFNGGIQETLGKMYEKSLANLDKTLDYEINTYSVKVIGKVRKLETFYLKQIFTSKISNISRNARIVFPKITAFCIKNNIVVNGKPFIIYHTFDEVNGLAQLSFCIPINEEIFTSEQSDILAGKLEAFDAVKTTLTGDHSHLKTALGKTKDYINVNRFTTESGFSHLEIYTIGKTEIKNPSKWVTEIYIPIKPKVIPVKVYKAAVAKKVDTVVAPTKSAKDIPSEF
jgi:carbon monoxide dehydrogenase subunit G/effector-binding domain-containing protein